MSMHFYRKGCLLFLKNEHFLVKNHSQHVQIKHFPSDFVKKSVCRKKTQQMNANPNGLLRFRVKNEGIEWDIRTKTTLALEKEGP